MPVKSGKQFRLMQAAKHKKIIGGPSKEVAAEFLDKTSHKQKSKYAKEKR